jgi:hypothetical protein
VRWRERINIRFLKANIFIPLQKSGGLFVLLSFPPRISLDLSTIPSTDESKMVKEKEREREREEMKTLRKSIERSFHNS